MNRRAVLFDLDGTLLDTLHDIAAAANCVLTGRGFPAHPVDAYRRFVGDGVVMLLTRALPTDERNEKLVGQCVDEFGEAYRQNWNVHTRPYDGVIELLKQLAQAACPMAVLSNKPHEFTQKCVREYLPHGRFRMVEGQRDSIPRKPDPAGAVRIAHQLRIATRDCLFLGDSSVDMETARRAGMVPVGAGWGFRSHQELQDSGACAIIDFPLDLLQLEL